MFTYTRLVLHLTVIAALSCCIIAQLSSIDIANIAPSDLETLLGPDETRATFTTTTSVTANTLQTIVTTAITGPVTLAGTEIQNISSSTTRTYTSSLVSEAHSISENLPNPTATIDLSSNDARKQSDHQALILGLSIPLASLVVAVLGLWLTW